MPDELANDLKLRTLSRKLRNIRTMSNVGGDAAQRPVPLPEIQHWQQLPITVLKSCPILLFFFLLCAKYNFMVPTQEKKKRLWIPRNQETLEKCQMRVKTQPNAQSPFQKPNPANSCHIPEAPPNLTAFPHPMPNTPARTVAPQHPTNPYRATLPTHRNGTPRT